MPENNDTSNNEIDLLDLTRKIGYGIKVLFQKAGTGILIAIVFLLRNWVYLFLSVILGVGASYLLKYTTKRFYTSEMILSSNSLPASDLVGFVNKLHTFSKENNSAAIANSLTIDMNKAKNIKDIQAFWMIDRGKDGIADEIDFTNSHNLSDTLNIRMQSRFAVQVKISVPQELIELRDGLIRYIENNQLFLDQNKMRLSQLDEMMERISYDIIQLDSLQKIKYYEEAKRTAPEKGGQMIFLQEQKTQLIYDNIQKLYTERQNLEKQKEIFSGVVTLLSDFTSPAKPKNGALYYGKGLIPLFFGLCIIILIGLKNKKKISEVYHKY
jgi:hypothetical protein